MNTFGHNFRLTTFGESHGAAIGGIIDGCPSGIPFDQTFLESEMLRRHEGSHATPRQEPDRVEILSGILNGTTLGTPIGFSIANLDQRSEDYEALADCYRPGHADYTWQQRFGLCDHRGGGRASARETAARVVGGAIAKMFLNTKGISIHASLEENTEPTPTDSTGGIISCTIEGMPAGIGNPVFGKLNASLAAAVMSIPSAIGFEVGCGFAAAKMKGSEYADQWNCDFSTQSNHCGGIQGGISNGMPVVFRAAFHPAVTLPVATQCITKEGELKTVVTHGRHDTNHLPRTVVIVEAMTALTIADFVAVS